MTPIPRIATFTTSLLLTTGLTQSVSAEELNSLLDLELEQLLKIKVSVASVGSESIKDTPAIVSRYERSDLEKMGISNLRDMFHFVPGVIVQNALTGLPAVQIRGIDEAFNQKVLFLLDGIPYHQPSHSLIPLDGIPWEAISHIEVIRGPGTVFHGTQASGGVINVITRDNPINNTLVAKTGSHQLRQASGYFSEKWGDSHQFYLGGEVRRQDPEVVAYEANFPDIGRVVDDIAREQEIDSILFKYQGSNSNLLAHVFSDKNVGINDAYADENTLQPFTTESEAYLLHVDTHWQYNNVFGEIYADYNFYTFDFKIDNLFAPGANALVKKEGRGEEDYRFRIGSEVNYQPSAKSLWTLGLEHESRSADRYNLYNAQQPNTELATLIEKDKTDELSVYSQFDITSGNWRYMLGGRYTDHEQSGSQLSPRLGLIYSYNNYQTFKALYSTGYNAPNPSQTNINLPGDIQGNPGLSAETVSSFDVAYSYTDSNLLFIANIYRMEAKDFIIRRYSQPLDSVSFFNEGVYTREGAELDFQVAFNKLKIFTNLAYMHQGNTTRSNDPDAYRIPKLTSSSGLNYTITASHSVGSNMSYIGERTGLGAYTVFGFNYTATLGRFDIIASIDNAFDKKVKNPNNTSQNSTLSALDNIEAIYQLGIRARF